MKQISLCIALFLSVMLTAGTSFAQEIVNQTGKTGDQAEPQIAELPGLMLQLGLGYGTIAAFDAGLMLGVKIKPMFGLYANAVFKLGDEEPNYGYEFTVVPKIHFLNRGIAQLSIGFGFGYEYYEKKVHPELTLDPLISKQPTDTYSTKAFVFKPELDLDFFLSESYYLGFGLDVPIFIGKEHRDKPRDYALHLSNGMHLLKSRHESEDKFAKGARFDFLIHLGCRFQL